MKLRKAIEITMMDYGSTKGKYTMMYETTDTYMIRYWEKNPRFFSKRTVYRMANRRLWNWTEDGSPF